MMERPHIKYEEIDEMNEVLFQNTLIEIFDKRFSVDKKLDEHGINILNPQPNLRILTDKKSRTVRDFNKQMTLDWKREDVGGLSKKRMLMQEEYNEDCEKIINEYKDDFSLNYSFDKVAPSKLKRALNSWIRRRTEEENGDKVNLIILQELQRKNTEFRKLIEDSIREYADLPGDKQNKYKVYEEYIDTIELPPEKMTYFNVGFDNKKYKNFEQCECINFAFHECYLKKDSTRPERDFMFKILKDNPKIEWWYKQKDFGPSVFGVKYYDNSENIDRIFYPDFIFKTTNNKLFVVDTKQGQTAKSIESIDKAKGLYDVYTEK